MWDGSETYWLSQALRYHLELNELSWTMLCELVSVQKCKLTEEMGMHWNESMIFSEANVDVKALFFPLQRQVWTRKRFWQRWQVKHVQLDLTDTLPDQRQSVRVEDQESRQVADCIPARESCCCARRVSQEERWRWEEDKCPSWAEEYVSNGSCIYVFPLSFFIPSISQEHGG